MKPIALISALFLSMLIFSTAVFAAPHEEAQERLGKAIQEAAHNTGDESAQERLGLAILEAASASPKTEIADSSNQEDLGRLIRDSAFLSYAHGVLQQEMGTTILGIAQG